MRALPTHRLNPRIKSVWRLNDAINITIIFALIFGFIFLLNTLEPAEWASIGMFTIIVMYVLTLIIWLIILPPIRFQRWRYELTENYIDIAHGIVWRKRTIIPFVRVQNTDTRQGPILRAFRLAEVTVATAAGEHKIPGLETDVADGLRDRAAELARLAQEDV